jgi:hypothetical protein
MPNLKKNLTHLQSIARQKRSDLEYCVAHLDTPYLYVIK